MNKEITVKLKYAQLRAYKIPSFSSDPDEMVHFLDWLTENGIEFELDPGTAIILESGDIHTIAYPEDYIVLTYFGTPFLYDKEDFELVYEIVETKCIKK